MVKTKKRNWKKVVGLIMVIVALNIFLPCWYLPTDFETYFLPLLPIIGLWAIVMPFGLAAIMLVAGMKMLGLPLNGKGVKRAMKKVKIKGKKK